MKINDCKGMGNVMVFVGIGIMLLVFVIFSGIMGIISTNQKNTVEKRNQSISEFWQKTLPKPKQEKFNASERGYTVTY
jgi:hypothetical protein